MRSRMFKAFLLFTTFLPAAQQTEGVVQTVKGRLAGSITISDGRMSVAGKPIPWNEVITSVLNWNRQTITAPNVVRLKSGESWPVEAISLSSKKLRVRSSFFGLKELRQAQLAVLDFQPQRPAANHLKASTLYRRKGEPIPGPLLWIDKTQIAIDSPLGVLKVPRRDAARYVFSTRSARTPKIDVVSLLDGTILHGNLKPAKDGFTLVNQTLGEISIPVAAVRTIWKPHSGVVHLSDLTPKVKATPLIQEAAPPSWHVQRIEAPFAIGSQHCYRGLRLHPTAEAVYRQPQEKTFTLRTILGSIKNAKGEARLKISVGTNTVFEKIVTPTATPSPLSVRLPSGSELKIEIFFGEPMRFPCGILLGDPMLVQE